MATQTTGAAAPSPLDPRIAGYGYQNWDIDGPPPIMINPAATLHTKLAWCWGEVCQIDELGSTLLGHTDHSLQSAGAILAARVGALLAMLEHLSEASRTRKSPINTTSTGSAA